MHSKAGIDITGQVFHNLTAIERVGKLPAYGYMWRCVCVCGKERVVATSPLRQGDVKSCGCLNSRSRAAAKKRNIKPIDLTQSAPFTAEDTRILLLLIIKQAIDDLQTAPVTRPNRSSWHLSDTERLTAEWFIWEEEPIQVGDLELTFEDICDMLDINADYIRRKIQEPKYKRKYFRT